MAWYPYSYKTAFDPATMNLAPVGSLGQVYAIGDTGFSTPLTTYDLSGLPVALAVQNDAGYIPSFQVEDQTSVIWKSGEYVLELVTSMPLPGPTGAKIVNATDNGDGTMSFELSDGSTVGPINVPEGPQGERGPAGYNATGAVEDQQTLADYINATAGANPVFDALHAQFPEKRAVSVADHGGSPTASSAINADAFTAAVAEAAANGTKVVEIPESADYSILGDIIINASDVTLRGRGKGTRLRFIDGGLILRGSGGSTVEGIHLEDFTLQRFLSGSSPVPGPALSIDAADGAAIRFSANRVKVTRVQDGDALHASGVYSGIFTDCYFGFATTGINAVPHASNGTTLNATIFVGGEIQSCDQAVNLDGGNGLTFSGTTFQGNKAGILAKDTDGLAIAGGYFESNDAYDVRLEGGDVSTEWGDASLNLSGAVFMGSTNTGTHGIQLVRGAVHLTGCRFLSYPNVPVGVMEANEGDVYGHAMSNSVAGSSHPQVVALNGSTRFLDMDTPRVAWAEDAGIVSGVTLEAGVSKDVAITYTPGRFTTNPVLAFGFQAAEPDLSVTWSNVSTSGVTLKLQAPNARTVNVHWTARQMNP